MYIGRSKKKRVFLMDQAEIPTTSNMQKDAEENAKKEVDREQHYLPEFEEVWQKAVTIQPYEGELLPHGPLQSAISYASVHASTILASNHNHPASQIFKAFAPKLDELRKHRRFLFKDFKFSRWSQIEQGSSAVVHRSIFQNDVPVAIKRFTDYSNPTEIVKEIHTLIQVQNKRVVKLLGAFHDGGTHLVMQLWQGSLRNTRSLLSERQKVVFPVQLLQAVDFLHQRNILHLDITPDNAYVTCQNNVVLGNFGCSQHLPKGVDFLRLGAKMPLVGKIGYCDAFANSGIYSKATDIFGLACTIFEINNWLVEPLLQYKNWNDAPVEEYITAAKTGRLRAHPPTCSKNPKTGQLKWDVSGERQPMQDRVKNSFLRRLLHDMVQHNHRRPGAGELLLKHKLYLQQKLETVDMSLESLDEDSDLDHVCLRLNDVLPPPAPCLSPDMNMALDHIYFDCKISLDSITSSVTETATTSSVLERQNLKPQAKCDLFGCYDRSQDLEAQSIYQEEKSVSVNEFSHARALTANTSVTEQNQRTASNDVEDKVDNPCDDNESTDVMTDEEENATTSRGMIRNVVEQENDIVADVTENALDPELSVSVGTGKVPIAKRGRPAPYKNVPKQILKQKNLQEGDLIWMDCPICNEFYTVDYDVCYKHMVKCYHMSKRQAPL